MRVDDQIYKEILGRFVDSFLPDIAIGEGWHDLVADLHTKLSYISPEYKLYQVKEKFGGLRYYAEYCPQEYESKPDLMRSIFNDVVTMAESNSYYLCATCGTPIISISQCSSCRSH